MGGSLGRGTPAAVERDEADDGTEYYFHWVAALEKLVASKGLAGEPELYERKEAWADAYRHTPHGQPVQLRPGFRVSYEYRQSPLIRVTRADGVSKEIRVQDGHLFVCNGCCCGRTEKGFPALPLEEFKQQWKKRGFRRRFHLTISGCLGPCPLANVVLLQFRGRSMWFHSINHAKDVDLIYNYVERMLQGETELDVPAELAGPPLSAVPGGITGGRVRLRNLAGEDGTGNEQSAERLDRDSGTREHQYADRRQDAGNRRADVRARHTLLSSAFPPRPWRTTPLMTPAMPAAFPVTRVPCGSFSS